MTRTATSATAERSSTTDRSTDRTTRFDGGYTVNWTTFREALDMAPVLASLPGGRCSCPHWGQLLSGRVVVHYEDHDDVSRPATPTTWRPGTSPRSRPGTEFFMFSPTDELAATEAGDPGRDAAPVAAQNTDQKTGPGGSRPASTCPAAANTSGRTMKCWVTACTSRSRRCSGELSYSALPPPAR